MLPAEQGDALFIEYGSAPSPHRVLIDAGVRKTSGLVKARIAELPENKRHFDLLIVTHVDSDHIGGIPKLLDDRSPGVHLRRRVVERVAAPAAGPARPGGRRDLLRRSPQARLDWNAAFDEKAIVVRSSGRLPKRELPGGMTLTLLSPTRSPARGPTRRMAEGRRGGGP